MADNISGLDKKIDQLAELIRSKDKNIQNPDAESVAKYTAKITEEQKKLTDELKKELDLLRQISKEREKHKETEKENQEIKERNLKLDKEREKLERSIQKAAERSTKLQERLKQINEEHQRILNSNLTTAQKSLKAYNANTKYESTRRQINETYEKQIKLEEKLANLRQKEQEKQNANLKDIEEKEKKIGEEARESEKHQKEKIKDLEAERSLNDNIIEQLKTKIQRTLGLDAVSGNLLENIERAHKLEGAKGLLGMGVDALDGAISRFAVWTAIFKHVKDAIIDIDKLNSEFVKETGQLPIGFNPALINNQTRFGVGSKDVMGAFKDLTLNQSGFTNLAGGQQGNLARAAALMDRFGISVATTGQIFDNLNKTLGYSIPELSNVEQHLVKTAIASGIPPKAIVEGFANAMPKLAAYGKQSVEIFEKMAKAAKSLGIEANTLIDIFEQYDQFENTGMLTGKLNSVLGGDFLNSIEFMQATTENKIIMMKQAVDAAGIQFQTLDKFSQKAIASAAGITDMAQANKLFGKSTIDLISDMNKQAASQDELEERLARTATFQERWNKLLDALIVILTPITTLLEWIARGISFIADTFGGSFIPIVATAVLALKIMAAILAPMTVAMFTFGNAVLFALGPIGLIVGAIWSLHWAFNKRASPSTLESVDIMEKGINKLGVSIDNNIGKIDDMNKSLATTKFVSNGSPLLEANINENVNRNIHANVIAPGSVNVNTRVELEQTKAKITQRHVQQLEIVNKQKEETQKLNQTLSVLASKMDNFSPEIQNKIILDGKELKHFVLNTFDNRKLT